VAPNETAKESSVMKNYVQDGNVITLIAPYTVTSGQGLLVGSVFGVATFDALNGATVEAAVEGVLDIAKAAGAVTQGALMYWDNAAKLCTTVSTSNKLIGVATQAQASGDATCRVRLNGAFIS
jgi:predicted RecA/RadA family phage recombinase